MTGKGAELKGFSIFKMSEVLDQVDTAMQAIKQDPKVLLKPDFDIFERVAKECPEFKKWRQEHLEA